MSWKFKNCNNCNRDSYTLYKHNKCPFCDLEHLIIHGILSNQIPDEKIMDYIKNHNINLSEQDVENIKLMKKL
jgi:hypothetical protein